MSNKPIIWNYGGGKQTAAIAVLIRQGVLPRPERIVMADTGRYANLLGIEPAQTAGINSRKVYQSLR